MTTETKEEFEIRTLSERKRAFDAFMSQPSNRLLISMIPAGDHTEIVETVLKEAFNAGWTHGRASFVLSIFRSLRG